MPVAVAVRTHTRVRRARGPSLLVARAPEELIRADTTARVVTGNFGNSTPAGALAGALPGSWELLRRFSTPPANSLRLPTLDLHLGISPQLE